MLCLASLLGALLLGQHWSEQRGLHSLRTEAAHKLDLFAAAVESAVLRLEYVPATVQLNPDVLRLLRQPQQPGLHRAVHDYLRRLNAHLGSAAVFISNERGVIVASSNETWPDDSQAGSDVAFRPYFAEALAGRVGRHFALGMGNEQPAYFVSHPVRDGAQVLGVAVLKISLDRVGEAWPMLGAPALLADRLGVVMLSSRPEWRYTTLAPLSLDDVVNLRVARHYGEQPLRPFPVALDMVVDADSQAVEGRAPASLMGGRGGPGLLVQGRRLNGMDWRLLLFEDLSAVRRQALQDGLLAALLSACLVLALLYLGQRRRLQSQQAETKTMLERINAELEHKVARRTRALTEVNQRLRKEVAERTQAEHTLRAAQDELVQAAKMAVLGQLATGITHELSQPLGAVRTLAGNAAEFLRRGQTEVAQNNLAIVARLIDQMGQIIQPLKSFARQAQPQPGAVDVLRAVDNALLLFAPRLREQAVQLHKPSAAGPCIAWCDSNRLEQVLINLLANALDAMRQHTDTPTLTLRVGVDDARGLRLEVQDNGPGLSEATLARLFTPFFTTKPEGAGLGLGLAISRDIVREFHGELLAANRPEGGACFTIWLPTPPAPCPPPPTPP